MVMSFSQLSDGGEGSSDGGQRPSPRKRVRRAPPSRADLKAAEDAKLASGHVWWSYGEDNRRVLGKWRGILFPDSHMSEQMGVWFTSDSHMSEHMGVWFTFVAYELELTQALWRIFCATILALSCFDALRSRKTQGDEAPKKIEWLRVLLRDPQPGQIQSEK